mgnify:CR=1 FL=1
MKFILPFLLFTFFAVACYAQKPLFPPVEGWNLKIEEQVYDANNLWDLINGAADLFLEYSFVDLHLARYSNDKGIEVKAELYRHAGPVEAFGMYSQERDPGFKFINIGLQGYAEEGVLNFLDGEYYIKMTTHAKGADAQKALESIAVKISAGLAKKNSMPELFSFFPDEIRMKNSDKYVSQNFMGHSFLKNAATVSYGTETRFTTFIIKCASSAEAEAAFEQWKKEAGREAVSELEKGKFVVNNPLDGKIILSVKNNYMFGIVNCGDDKTALKYLNQISDKIK